MLDRPDFCSRHSGPFLVDKVQFCFEELVPVQEKESIEDRILTKTVFKHKDIRQDRSLYHVSDFFLDNLIDAGASDLLRPTPTLSQGKFAAEDHLSDFADVVDAAAVADVSSSSSSETSSSETSSSD